MTDFWPAVIKETPGLVPPITLLKEAGTDLGDKTNHMLRGQVETNASGGDYDFEHIFYIVAPALDNYRYEILRVLHGITLYPARVIRRPAPNVFAPAVIEDAPDAAQLRKLLQAAFNDPTVQKAVGALLAQSKAA